jgi:hypothetical protein
MEFEGRTSSVFGGSILFATETRKTENAMSFKISFLEMNYIK